MHLFIEYHLVLQIFEVLIFCLNLKFFYGFYTGKRYQGFLSFFFFFFFWMPHCIWNSQARDQIQAMVEVYTTGVEMPDPWSQGFQSDLILGLSLLLTVSIKFPENNCFNVTCTILICLLKCVCTHARVCMLHTKRKLFSIPWPWRARDYSTEWT